jgi:hypothetical protein
MRLISTNQTFLERCNSKAFRSLQRRPTLFRRQLWPPLQHSTFGFDQLLASKSDPVNNTVKAIPQLMFCILKLTSVIASIDQQEEKLKGSETDGLRLQSVARLCCIQVAF